MKSILHWRANVVEMRVFAEEPEAWVNGLHIADFGGADHAVDLQIALIRTAGPTQ